MARKVGIRASCLVISPLRRRQQHIVYSMQGLTTCNLVDETDVRGGVQGATTQGSLVTALGLPSAFTFAAFLHFLHPLLACFSKNDV
jgi:hypothetical protein